ncbi:MAG TPA: dihydroorotase, partial [Vicinamibacterales bacterium]|nr:dihydroorotase [Vicinamibacterales bacterium]
LARVYPIGAVSRGQAGEQLADIAELKQAGCVALSDDGHPVSTALLARRAMEYAGMFGLPLIEHCEDPSLKGDGVVHEGPMAASLGLKGIPGIAEAITAGRDILIAEMVGGHVHVAHMSAWTTLEAVRQGKSRGVKVTCEVAPHHFTLTDALLGAPVPYDTDTKMNPPLREQRDLEAMLAGIADGSVDVIATDHAPHHADEKNVEYDRAPFGIVGLETAIPIALDRLVHAGVIRLPRLVEMMSMNPAAILKVPGGSLQEGAVADITILAPDQSVTIDRHALVSKSHNTPYHGWTFRGAAAATIVGGRVVHANAASGIALAAEER